MDLWFSRKKGGGGIIKKNIRVLFDFIKDYLEYLVPRYMFANPADVNWLELFKASNLKKYIKASLHTTFNRVGYS